MWNNTLTAKHTCFFSCTTHQSSFQNLLLRCHFLSFVVKALFRLELKKRCRRALGDREAHLCRVTTVPVLHRFHRYRRQRYTHNTSSTFTIVTTLLIDFFSPQNRNDHVWSLCRYTRSYRLCDQLDEQKNVIAWSEPQNYVERKLVMDRFHQSLLGEVHVTSQRKHTLTIVGIHGRTTCLLAGARQTRIELQLRKRSPRV